MNERIRELAVLAYEQQPLIVANPQTYEAEHKIGNGAIPMYQQVFNQEKFAELIVRECLNICLECIDDGCVEAQEPMWKIEQHFGVKS